MILDVDLCLRAGGWALDIAFASDARITALTGPSGAGKTSVLDAIAGLRAPARGHVRVQGRELSGLPPEARNLGYVFQDARLFPHLSVRANLLYGARDPAALPGLAAELGITHLLDRWPRHLSGGETRRVAIGRAVLRAPALLLLDEPTAHLDRALAADVLALVARLSARVPVLMVSHHPSELEALRALIVPIAV